MDGSSFDRLAIMASIGLTRRRLVAIAAALAGGGAALAVDRASAARVVCRSIAQSCTRGSQCCSGFCQTSRFVARRERYRCACEGGKSSCGGVCCGDGERCVAGVCHGYCRPEGDAFWCTETAANDVIQDCGGEAPGFVGCETDDECADILPYCGDPGIECVCAYVLNDGAESIFQQEPGFGLGLCSARFLLHPDLVCNWTAGGRSGGICGSAAECISSAWDAANTACVSSVCVYNG